MREVCFINTVGGLEKDLNALTKKHLPDYKPVHKTEPALIQDILQNHGVTDHVRGRLTELVTEAENDGAVAVQLTCSTISGTAKELRKGGRIPVFTIDNEVYKRVLAAGYKRIGICATNPYTIQPSTESLQEAADKLNKNPEVKTVVCEGAFDALLSKTEEGKKEHDRIVTRDLKGLMEEVDVVVLAQASMARVADLIPEEERPVPILTSPEPAIEALAEYLKGQENASKKIRVKN